MPVVQPKLHAGQTIDWTKSVYSPLLRFLPQRRIRKTRAWVGYGLRLCLG
jgi:hypothetical protein